GKSWTCHTKQTDRRGRQVARCEVGGEDIQKWMVANGWALAYLRFSNDYEADEKAAREAKAGMWQGAFIAPWDWRVRNKKTAILGAAKPPENARAILLASASGSVAPSPDCTIKGNVNRSGECIYHTPASRWYAKIQMKVSKGTRWFCSVEDAEAAGCRETRR
ncbi:MAG: thermonuclease family protein, partial [Bradyrhizobium sp.]